MTFLPTFLPLALGFLAVARPTVAQNTDGLVAVDESVWVEFYDQPAHHFSSAREAFQKHRYATAADEIVLGNSYIRLRAESAKVDEAKQSLENAVVRLDWLAHRVRREELKNVGGLDHAFAHAEAALALHAIRRAEDEAAARHAYVTGFNLKAAAFHLDHGFAWAGSALSPAEVDSVGRAALYGQELEDGGSLDAERAKVLAEDLGAQLTHLEDILTLFPGGTAMPASVSAATSEWMTIGSEAWLLLADEPLHHEYLARERFLLRDDAAAAAEIRKVATWLHVEAANSTGSTQGDVVASAEALDVLAGEVAQGEVGSIDRIERAFGRAEQALAKNQEALAAAAWRRKDARSAGGHLRAAMHHLEHGLAWTGHEIEAGSKLAYEGVEYTVGKLVEGSGWTADEVGKALTTVGAEIEELGRWIQPG